MKVLKWAYNMGVKAERARIKHAIDEIRLKQKEFSDELILFPPNTVTDKKELGRRQAINYEVSKVLNDLTKPTFYSEVVGPSKLDSDKLEERKR